MRPALLLIPLLMLSACGPSEKPADVATAAEVEAASQLPQLTYTDSSELAGSCRLEIGDEEAHKLVQRCVTLSPETKQLCHVDTSCKIIRNEIKHACDTLPINRQLPAECG